MQNTDNLMGHVDENVIRRYAHLQAEDAARISKRHWQPARHSFPEGLNSITLLTTLFYLQS